MTALLDVRRFCVKEPARYPRYRGGSDGMLTVLLRQLTHGPFSGAQLSLCPPMTLGIKFN
jgi:hypothetical protein